MIDMTATAIRAYTTKLRPGSLFHIRFTTLRVPTHHSPAHDAARKNRPIISPMLYSSFQFHAPSPTQHEDSVRQILMQGNHNPPCESGVSLGERARNGSLRTRSTIRASFTSGGRPSFALPCAPPPKCVHEPIQQRLDIALLPIGLQPRNRAADVGWIQPQRIRQALEFRLGNL